MVPALFRPRLVASLLGLLILVAVGIALRPRPARGPVAEEARALAAYAGSQSCRSCHARAYGAWAGSHHGRAERELDPVRDRSAFDPPRTFRHGSQSTAVRVSGGRFEIEAPGPSGRAATFVPARLIGVSPLWQLLIPYAGGRLQVTEAAYEPAKGEWFDVFGEEDRKSGEWGHWTGRGMNWNSMCAACHNTRLRKGYEPSTDTYATTMAERAVGCEACHGPMADHASWQKAHAGKAGDPTRKRFAPSRVLDTCGSCHSRRGELTGAFRPGEAFLDHYTLVIPDETEVYYADGQVREEDYEYASFLGSRMHLSGVVCTSCHDPHAAKPLAPGNWVCLRCHDGQVPKAPRIDAMAHGHHKAEGGRCVDCHMPQTTYMQRHPRHDHGFTIPDPLLTKLYGIPNACGRCHADRGEDWQLAAVQKWYGARMERPTRARAQRIARARAGEKGAEQDLVRMVREEEIPLWRASAASLLKRWVGQPSVRAALLERLSDPEPLVRAMAARSLEALAREDEDVGRALRLRLSDPVRMVRVDAAWALRATVDPASLAGRDLLASLEHNRDQPTGALQLGLYHMDRGDVATAVALFQRAVSWDPGSPGLRQPLAVGLSLQGKKEEAVRELEAACRLAPRDPDFRYRLALAQNEAGRPQDAAGSLEETVRLDPRFAHAWYELGLLSSSLKRPDRALGAFARAEALDPRSPQVPYARAVLLARLGRLEEARAAARQALEIQPSFAEAGQLLRTLSRRPPSERP